VGFENDFGENINGWWWYVSQRHALPAIWTIPVL